jgi:elongator complex protein 2
MNTLAIVKNNDTLSSKILSGGDEKVLRLFEAPFNFIKTMNALNPQIVSDESKKLCFSTEMSNAEVESRIEGEAKKQPLGLMNKPAALVPSQKSESNESTQIDTTETDASDIRNKARVNDNEEGGQGVNFDPVTVLTNVNKTKEVIRVKEPPVEDILMARTLWPEQKKMYGHVFELFSLATTHQGDAAASACKSKEPKYAEIHIWDLTQN